MHSGLAMKLQASCEKCGQILSFKTLPLLQTSSGQNGQSTWVQFLGKCPLTVSWHGWTPLAFMDVLGMQRWMYTDTEEFLRNEMCTYLAQANSLHHVQCAHPLSLHLCGCSLGHVHTSRGLEPLQNYAALIILCGRVSASATDMWQELHWPTLASRRAVSEAMAVYESVSGRSLAYLSALFHPSASTHQHATRYASTGASKSTKWELKWGKRRLPSEELLPRRLFSQIALTVTRQLS